MVCKIGGILYHDLSSDAAARLILKAALSHTAFSVFTPGATIAAQAEKSPSLVSLLGRADLCLPDGVGCKLAARLAGEKLSHVATGIDTAERLLSLADAYGLRVFLYGGREGVAQAAARRLSEKHPHLTFGTAHGYGKEPLEEILAFRPDLVFVSLGFPKQEAWIAQNVSRLSSPAIGLGGSIDVWSGRLMRAPLLFRALGLEWLWRTAREPRRIVRLLPLPAYLLGCAWQGGRKVLQNFQKTPSQKR